MREMQLRMMRLSMQSMLVLLRGFDLIAGLAWKCSGLLPRIQVLLLPLLLWRR